MVHFSEADWADFVRGMPMSEAGRMTVHLNACEECRDLVSAMRAVADVYLRDAVETPSANAVHSAEAIFSMWVPDRVRLFSPGAARLVFDSFASPAVAGIRSGQPMHRQLMYEARPYVIDLRLDHQRGGRRMALTGQVASADPTKPIAGVRVTLAEAAGGRIIEQLRTNATGEFDFEYEPAPHLQLRVDVESSPHIDLPSDVRVADDDHDFGRK